MDIAKLEETLRSMNAVEFNKILDSRDEGEFDASWCEHFEKLDNAELDIAIDREALFKRISEACSSHEITSYIVDDFELLEKAKKVNINSEFIRYMQDCYQQGEVPYQWPSC